MYIMVAKSEKEFNNLKGELQKFIKENGLTLYKVSFDEEVTSNIAASLKMDQPTNIYEFLLYIGIKPHLSAFEMLKYLFESDLKCSDGLVDVVYTALAEKFGSTPAGVERSIRYAVFHAFTNSEYKQIHSAIFGNDSRTPTNKHFIEGCRLYLEQHNITN